MKKTENGAKTYFEKVYRLRVKTTVRFERFTVVLEGRKRKRITRDSIKNESFRTERETKLDSHKVEGIKNYK